MMSGGRFGMVRARPDIEQIVTRYERLQADVLLRLSAEIDGLHWQRGGDERRADCASCPGHDGPGQRRSLRRWTARIAIPEPRWADALALVREITDRHRFGPPRISRDRPGDHRAAFPDPYGGTLRFATGVQTVLGVTTGCHPVP
jgi:hypothetical protein